MRINKNAFTLIELLAVIVILAIIALIATPIILGIINDAKEQSTMRSAELYIDAVEQAIVRKNLEGEYNPEECKIESGEVTCEGKFSPTHCEIKNGQLNCEGVPLEVEIDGEVPPDGTIVFQNGKAISGTELTFKEYRVNINEQGKMEINPISKQETIPEEPIPAPVSFAEDSWDTIAKNVKVGNLGVYETNLKENKNNTKEIELDGFSGTFTVRIANVSTPAECNNADFSQTACGFVVEFEDIIEKQKMNSSKTNVGGWEKSILRARINNEIYNALPAEIKKNIIDTKVVSGQGLSDKNNFVTTDKLYLLSTKEIWGDDTSLKSYDKATLETRQLDYYLEKNTTLSNRGAAIKKYNNVSTIWWLRTSGGTLSSYFLTATTQGGWYDDNPTNVYGVSPAFRITYIENE